MRRSAAIAFAFLALYWTAAPLLACLRPERAMSAQEHECCQHMAEMCGSAKMPQSHSCCKTEVRAPNNMVVCTDHHAAPSLHVVAALPAPNAPELYEWSHERADARPPSQFLPDPIVLRI